MPHFCPHCTACIEPGTLVKTRKAVPRAPVSKPPAKANARSRLWTSMRVMPRFTHHDLAATAETSLANAGAYVRALQKVRYLRCVHDSSGEVGDHSVYALIRNTGPLAPRLHNGGGVYDCNLQQEVRNEP